MHSADILPFRTKTPPQPEDRLRSALRQLDDAMAGQKLALTEFRTNLGALGGAVAGLQSRLQSYRGSLASTAQDVKIAGNAARRLEATADIWLGQGR